MEKKNMENKKINNFNLFIGQNESEVGIKASSEIINLVRNNPKAVLGLATGSSPLSTYKEIVNDHKVNLTSWKKIKTFNLDEYIGIPEKHPKSYRTFMNENLFDLLNIKHKNTHVPLTENNIEKNIEKFEKKLSKNKVDIQILGIGSNGHIAFNEPGSSFESTTYITDLTKETIEANSRFFKSIDEVPKKAVTMGIKSILKAERIILIAIGKSKSKAIYNMIYNTPPTEKWPCTALQNHPNVTVIIDRECHDGFKSKIK
jgi:glucosamine-6-phosphate deaminase